MFPLVETIRFQNGRFHNLTLHEQRMKRSCNELFHCSVAMELEKELIQPETVKTDLTYKVRIIYGKRIAYIEWLPYSPEYTPSFRLVECNDIDYHLKYKDRSGLNELSKQAQENETIIIVKNGMVTDTAYGNLLFWDGNNWITPSTPLLKGVMRESLLKSGEILEAAIPVEDLSKYFSIKMINAMRPMEEAHPVSVDTIINKADFIKDR